MSSPTSPAALSSTGETFSGGYVVQRLEPAAPGAPEVAYLHPVTVVVHDDRVEARDGTVAWVWRYRDLTAVSHGSSGPWTLLAVSGVDDHGVAVPDHEAARFRSALDHRRAVSGRIASLLAPPAPPVEAGLHEHPGLRPHDGTATGPVLDDPTVLLDLDEPVSPAAHQGLDGAPPPRSRPARRRWRQRSKPRHGARPFAGEREGALVGLQARDISAWFGDHQVLDRVSLDMAAGEVTALIGPSGCGKSTFLRVLNRMHELIPSASLAGEVRLEGHDIYDPQRKITDARRQIGMVFQKPNPFPAMSIYDNVVASLRLTGTKASDVAKDELVESCLTKAGLWGEVKDRLRQPGGGLSGGQQQRLCIARALAIKPLVLLMDEPCSALDPTSTRRIEQTISELKSEVTIVIVTHNMQQALRVSDQCAFFLAEQGTPGVIVEHGPTEAMFGTPQDQRTNDYVNGRFG